MTGDSQNPDTDLPTVTYQASLVTFVFFVVYTAIGLVSLRYDDVGGGYGTLETVLVFFLIGTFGAAFSWFGALVASWKLRRARFLLLLETAFVLLWCWIWWQLVA